MAIAFFLALWIFRSFSPIRLWAVICITFFSYGVCKIKSPWRLPAGTLSAQIVNSKTSRPSTNSSVHRTCVCTSIKSAVVRTWIPACPHVFTRIEIASALSVPSNSYISSLPDGCSVSKRMAFFFFIATRNSSRLWSFVFFFNRQSYKMRPLSSRYKKASRNSGAKNKSTPCSGFFSIRFFKVG